MPDLAMSLTQAIAELGPYPEDHPQTLRGLLAADPDEITSELAWYLRRQLVEANRSSERHFIHGPTDVLRLIANGYTLHPWTGAWVSYGLSADRQVLLVPHAKGGVASIRKATKLLPHVEDLPSLPRPDRSGRASAWLVIFGGTPDVLAKNGVARGLAKLASRAPVADVVFYHCDQAESVPPTLWSVRAGCGMSEGLATEEGIPFPEPELAELVRRAL